MSPRTSLPPSGTPLQTAATVVTAAAAVFAVLAQYKDRPLFAWALVFIALLFMLTSFYQPLAARLRAHRDQRHRDKAALAQYREFVRFVKRLQNFIEHQDAGNLRYILFDFCGNDSTKLSRIYPDYLWDLFPSLMERCENSPPKHEKDFSLAMRELSRYVNSYNRDYVLEPFNRMRSDQLLLGLPEQRRQDFERRIEDFRERWARFLDDLQQFLDRVDDALGGGGYLRRYFERPQKL